MKSKLALTALLACAVTLTACNTVRGAKKDVNSAGAAVEKATD
jgi:predicted small secreted protein